MNLQLLIPEGLRGHFSQVHIAKDLRVCSWVTGPACRIGLSLESAPCLDVSHVPRPYLPKRIALQSLKRLRFLRVFLYDLSRGARREAYRRNSEMSQKSKVKPTLSTMQVTMGK